MSEADSAYTPEQLAKAQEIEAYYRRDDLPYPDDDETSRPSPIPNVKKDVVDD